MLTPAEWGTVLPFRWIEEADEEDDFVARRDICPLNEGGPPPLDLNESAGRTLPGK